MVLFVVAVMVLVAVGVLLWKAVSAQALATGPGATDEETPTGPTRSPGASRPRRARDTAELGAATATRREQRERLRAALRGDAPSE